MENILVIRFGALGDVVLTLPVLEVLRARWPKARVSIAVKTAYASLFAEGSVVEGVFALDSDGTHGGAGGFRRYAEWLRKESFDLVVDLHASLRSRLLSECLRASEARRVSTHHLSRRALVRFGKPLWGYPGHIVDRFLAAVAADEEPSVNRIPRLRVSARARGEITCLLKGKGVRPQEELICLAPGAGRATKRWPAERYAALASRLVVAGSRVVCVAGSTDEANVVRSVADLARQKRVLPVVSSDLMLHAALMERASRVVTNDSGLMHLAEAAGTPVVAVFGSTAPALGFHPLRAGSRVLSVPLQCRPCSLHGLERCPRGHLACLEGISVDRVHAAVSAERKTGR